MIDDCILLWLANGCGCELTNLGSVSGLDITVFHLISYALDFKACQISVKRIFFERLNC